MKAVLLGFVLGIAGLSAQAQRSQNPAPSEQSHYALASSQKMRELACREQAARDMQKPVALPRGTTRAWELERIQRERLCLAQAAETNEAELQTHRHYKAKDGHEVHSPAKSTHDQVPIGASAKCRDGSYSFSQHRRGTCSHHGGVGVWL
jgi:Tfp pilus assembly protein PilV